jgi:Zn-dependent peptidase ImmA (M78 family)
LQLRRGFKSQCERRAAELRRAFNIPPGDPLKATKLAEFLRIEVWTESDVSGLEAADHMQLTIADPESWSAFVIRVEQSHLVVLNSTQSLARLNSVLMHEASHILLGHELTSASTTEDGFFVPTTYDQEQEDEANWLAGTLLLPRPALLKVRRAGLSDSTIMQEYLVSREMLTWRIRMTGIDYQLSYAAK